MSDVTKSMFCLGIAEEVSEESKALVTSYEDAMRKIQEATGVSDVQEVVNRFLVQGETQENLKRLQQENVDLLAKLRDVRASCASFTSCQCGPSD